MELPKIGDRVSVDKFHVSEMNVRSDEPFGDSEEDKNLIKNLRRGKIVQAFKARPEADGYGVYVGRRRFLAKLEAGAKTFVVGADCVIEDVTDEEARIASWTENLKFFSKSMNPVARAKGLAAMIAFNPGGMQTTARQLNIPKSNLSEWLKILELSDEMQKVVAEGLLGYTEAMKIARLKLGEELQNEMAKVLESEGPEAFQSELIKITTGRTRGIPRGMFEISRVSWDKRNRKEIGYYETIAKVAEAKKVKVPEYIKDFLIRHIEEIEREIA